MGIQVFHGDITGLEVDAIVNAANSALIPGGGVDGAIHTAGGPSIAEETAQIIRQRGAVETGEAVVTGAGLLPSRYVIHTVGPIWGAASDEDSVRLLGSCYSNSLDLAEGQACSSLAFPNISTGVYGFPKQLAASTAVESVRRWLTTSLGVVDAITFACFDEENYQIYRQLIVG